MYDCERGVAYKSCDRMYMYIITMAIIRVFDCGIPTWPVNAVGKFPLQTRPLSTGLLTFFVNNKSMYIQYNTDGEHSYNDCYHIWADNAKVQKVVDKITA